MKDVVMVCGSSALPQTLVAKAKVTRLDVDIIADYDTAVKYATLHETATGFYPESSGKKLVVKTRSKIFECEIAWENSLAKELIDLVIDNDLCEIHQKDGFTMITPNLDVLYTLKMSHRYLRNSPHFLKTRQNIMVFREAGAKIPECLLDWYKRREAATYDYGHPVLKQNKMGFFSNDNVPYKYEHDDIHIAVALGSVPAYTRYAADDSEVFSSKKKFFEASHSTRIFGVYEEAAVLAIERSLVPHEGALTPQRAFLIALQKVCTSITSGWFREFAWEHFDEVMTLYNLFPDYFEEFKKALALGKVSEYKGNLTSETESPIMVG